MYGRPLLQQVVVPFACASCEKMPSALEAELAVFCKGYCRIGSVNLFFEHDVTSLYLAETAPAHVFVACLQT